MRRILFYTIKPEEDGMTVHHYLTLRGYSHAVFVQLKKTPHSIEVNGIWYYVTDILHTGDSLCITLDEQTSSLQIQAVPMTLDIIHEDEDILVINKPADMPIHPSMNHYDHTLANGVMHYFTSLNIQHTFRCVNRLDRDTTGLTVIAKHMLSSAILSRQITSRDIHRTYLAIVEGDVPASGTIDAPIARKDGSTIERIVNDTDGERAVTHYKKIAYQNGLSLVALQLETGRTHQIRVHMKHIEHPLIGDFLYNPESSLMARQALHSFCLTFTHPITDEPVAFYAPLPDDMKTFFPDISDEQLKQIISGNKYTQ
jgi:23S rRNA pseudouridine1911/1915/1917 synthase